MLGDIIDLVFSLLIVIVAIVILSVVLKRYFLGRMMNNTNMQVISSLPLGSKERLLLVDVNGKVLLLGVTAQNISNLHEFENFTAKPRKASTHKFKSIMQQKSA
jgi:flagellar protein FliO/FliZ